MGKNAMGKIEQSPTPWTVGGHPRDDSGLAWREVLCETGHFGPSYVCQALEPDARFIVRACNSHEELLAALDNLLAKLVKHSLTPPVVHKEIAEAHRVIAKARGE